VVGETGFVLPIRSSAKRVAESCKIFSVWIWLDGNTCLAA